MPPLSPEDRAWLQARCQEFRNNLNILMHVFTSMEDVVGPTRPSSLPLAPVEEYQGDERPPVLDTLAREFPAGSCVQSEEILYYVLGYAVEDNTEFLVVSETDPASNYARALRQSIVKLVSRFR